MDARTISRLMHFQRLANRRHYNRPILAMGLCCCGVAAFAESMKENSMLTISCPRDCGCKAGCPSCKGKGFLYVIEGKHSRELPGFHYLDDREGRPK